MLTEKQAQALTIVKQQGPILPGQFADLMWPDSPFHQVSYQCGHGSTRGRGLVRSAGGYLGRLRKRGWIEQTWSKEMLPLGYVLTGAGERGLAEYQARHE